MAHLESNSKTTFVTVNRLCKPARIFTGRIQKQPLLLLIMIWSFSDFTFISIQKQPLLLLISSSGGTS